MLLPPFHPPSGDLFAMHGKEKADSGNKAGGSVGCAFGMWHVFHCELKKLRLEEMLVVIHKKYMSDVCNLWMNSEVRSCQHG